MEKVSVGRSSFSQEYSTNNPFLSEVRGFSEYVVNNLDKTFFLEFISIVTATFPSLVLEMEFLFTIHPEDSLDTETSPFSRYSKFISLVSFISFNSVIISALYWFASNFFIFYLFI
jgi:hypothetical protein